MFIEIKEENLDEKRNKSCQLLKSCWKTHLYLHNALRMHINTNLWYPYLIYATQQSLFAVFFTFCVVHFLAYVVYQKLLLLSPCLSMACYMIKNYVTNMFEPSSISLSDILSLTRLSFSWLPNCYIIR